jgi:hypothetical protein
MMMAHHCLIKREWMSPPARHHHYLGVFLLRAATFLGFLLHRDDDLYPLIGSRCGNCAGDSCRAAGAAPSMGEVTR